jgi:tyrocidine synthetase-3
VFMLMDSLPLTASGKLDRRHLPVPEYDDLSAGYVEPRTETEALLCRLCADVLELPLVGVEDNFFALGGHSLAAMRLITRIRDQQQFNLPLKYIFKYPTMAELGAVIESLQTAVAPKAIGQEGAEDFMV